MALQQHSRAKCQTDRLADKECEGHSGGVVGGGGVEAPGGQRQPGGQRDGVVFQPHAKSVTVSTHVKPRISAAATRYNPQTICLNPEPKWRVSSYISARPAEQTTITHENVDRLYFRVSQLYFLFLFFFSLATRRVAAC